MAELRTLLDEHGRDVGSELLYVTSYPPSWQHAGGAAYVDRQVLAAPRSAVETLTLTDTLTFGDPPDRTVVAASSLPLQVRSSRAQMGRTFVRMLARAEPYSVAKFRVFKQEWSRIIDELRRCSAGRAVVCSGFLPLLACMDARVPVSLYLAHNVEWRLSEASPLPGLDARRLRAMEMRGIRGARSTVALSASDTRALRAACPEAQVDHVRWTFNATGTPAPPSGSLRLGYLGSYSWPPNRTDVEHLRGTLLPMLAESLRVRPTLVLAGRGTEELRGLDGVVAIGTVEDVAEFYRQVDLVVVPRAESATGISVKVVEAMDHGVRVAATRSIAEAFGHPPALSVYSSPEQLRDLCRRVISGSP